MSRVVVKVGGSLYDWPLLSHRLRQFLTELAAGHLWLVPGGGPFADAVRWVDRTHRLGEEVAHWLALRSLRLAAEFLRCLVPEWKDAVVDMFDFAQADESREDHSPHVWEVTSDSLAARLALVVQADRLILLKSADPTPTWEKSDLVDGHFATVIRSAPFAVEAINLRNWQASAPDTSVS